MAARLRGVGLWPRALRFLGAGVTAACLCASAAEGGVLDTIQRSAVRTEVRAVPARSGDAPRLETADPSVMPQGTLQRGVLYQTELPRAQEQLIQAEFSRRLATATAAPPVLLPGVLRQEAQDGAELVLKPLVLVGQALSRAADGRFIGTILVGVKEVSDAAGGARELTAPVQFDVLETRLANPARVLVKSTAPHFESIEVTSTSARPLRLRVASRFAPEGVEVVVPVEALSLQPSTDEIDGFGLEAADLNISVVGLPDPAGRRVLLKVSGDSGYLEASRLALDRDGEATTRVRSSGLGPVKITASVAGLTATTEVRSRFPGLTLLAAALGALVGGLIRLLSEGRQLDRKRALAALAVSLLTGVLVFALYAVGVNVTPLNPTVNVGAVLVFAVSGIGAYLGTRLLKFGTAGT